MAIVAQPSRYARLNSLACVEIAKGWRLERVTTPSRLFGANGLRTGPDGHVYIAQVTGSQISVLDHRTGQLGTVSAKGGEIVAPDDVAFDANGNLYATEVMDGRVSMLDTAGRTRVLRDDVPSANGITVHRGRLFIGECREGGRLLELDLGGGPPRVLLENVPSPNAMEVGPDGLLYFPVMGANEIWRIDPDGSMGIRGLVTDRLTQVIHEARTDVIYASAPLGVLRPVCALAALATGDQHPLLTVIADHSIALLEVIRGIVADIDRSGKPPPDGPPGGGATTEQGPGTTAADAGAKTRYEPIPVTIEE